MEYVVTSEQERLQQIDNTMRNIEFEHMHVKAMQQAGNYNMDPARGPVIAPEPAGWEVQGRTAEEIVDDHLARLEDEHSKLRAIREQIASGLA